MKRLIPIVIICLSSFAVKSATLNVPANYATIQAALSAANIGDTILVQPGTYNENLIWPNTADLKLFAAGDTTNTVVDGGGSGRCLEMMVSMTNNTIIRGLRFTNGQSLLWASGTGAGIKLDNGASPSFEECMVDNCFGDGDRCYGAGVSVDGGTASFTNCAVIQNQAISTPGFYDYGAGFYIIGGADVTIANSDISQNSAPITSRSYGGGIYVSAATLTLNNCTVNENNIMGTNYAYGSGIYLTSSSVLNMTGGEVNGNMLSNTSRTYGGGFYINGSQANLYQVKIINQDLNTTTWSYGSGLYIMTGSNVYMENCLVANNMTGGTGFSYTGGGIYCSASDLELMHCTIADNNRVGNAALNGPGIYFDGAANTLTMRSSICYNPNPSTEFAIPAGTYDITYTDIRDFATGTGNINILPQFMSGTNHHLQPTSPCVEVADPASPITVDLENNPRPSAFTTIADMGCYEQGQPCTPSSASITETACDSYMSPSGNYTWTSTGTYSDTLMNASGCDSIISINLTINTADASVSNTDPTLTANATGASYQWVDCNNGYAPIAGETNQTFNPSLNGNYAVIVTQNGCTDTSACELIQTIGLEELLPNTRVLLKVTDLLGRATKPVPGTPLLFIYSDGSIERVFILE